MATRWVCPHCKTLLGLHDRQHLTLRYKTAVYRVKPGAAVEAVCRNCGKTVTAK